MKIITLKLKSDRELKAIQINNDIYILDPLSPRCPGDTDQMYLNRQYKGELKEDGKIYFDDMQASLLQDMLGIKIKSKKVSIKY